jgi:hypothetical protein
MESSLAGRSDHTSDFLSWAAALGGYVGVLVSRGHAAEACVFGRAALARCDELEIRGAAFDLVRELSVAEAKIGDHAVASERIDNLIASRQGVVAAHRAIDFEARVRVAIEAKDRDAVARYVQLLAQHGRLDAGYVVQPRHLQLSDEARRAGIPVELPETSFQTAVLAPRSALSRQLAITQVTTALAKAESAPDRARRALALLCEIAGDTRMRGQLYLAHATGLFLAASQAVPADDALDELVRSYWQELSNSDGATAIETQTDESGFSITDVWQRPDGSRYRPLVLRSMSNGAPRRVGLAILAANETAPLASRVWEVAGVLSTRLLELGDAHGVALE